MPVDNSHVIDAAGIDKDSGEVILTISDHLPWSGREHLSLLEKKLNRYLAFVQSGELLQSYPSARGRSVRINIVCKYAPGVDAESALAIAAKTLGNAALDLSWQVVAAQLGAQADRPEKTWPAA